MKSVRGEFKTEISFRPAFDKRNPDPAKNYGIHGMEIAFYLTGLKGSIQFIFYTGLMMKHVATELWAKNSYRDSDPFSWRGWDIGYHSPKPMYEGQCKMDECHLLEQGFCYYDGSSLNAEPIAEKFISEGEEPVWVIMEEWYKSRFIDRGYLGEPTSSL